MSKANGATEINLGILLRQMTERSTREVENLIDELHSLRTRLEADGDLIERAIVRHSELSQGAMELTTMIADNVKRAITRLDAQKCCFE